MPGEAFCMGDYFCGGYFRSPCGSGAFLLHPAHHGCGLPKSGVSISAFSKYGSGVRIGANRFSPRGIRMDLHADRLRVSGVLCFGPLTPIGCDIMGPFRWVPGMECRPANQITTQRSSGTWRGGAAERVARSDF